jgi:hypothetical protein
MYFSRTFLKFQTSCVHKIQHENSDDISFCGIIILVQYYHRKSPTHPLIIDSTMSASTESQQQPSFPLGKKDCLPTFMACIKEGM